jgi:two-component SAPR family response regulator
LTQAVKAATNNKTYKKASQYATKILKIDPLNTFAKQTLFSSYLAHARRIIISLISS